MQWETHQCTNKGGEKEDGKPVNMNVNNAGLIQYLLILLHLCLFTSKLHRASLKWKSSKVTVYKITPLCFPGQCFSAELQGRNRNKKSTFCNYIISFGRHPLDLMAEAAY